MRIHRRLAALMIPTVALVGGCALELGAPPLEISTRDSLIGAGKILRIGNTSNEELTALEIEIISPAGERRSLSLETLGAYETLEVGWKKLGGWQVVPGSEVAVRTEGFLLTYSGRLTEE